MHFRDKNPLFDAVTCKPVHL